MGHSSEFLGHPTSNPTSNPTPIVPTKVLRLWALEYFGTYLGYLLTNPMSQHSDTFPASPSWIPDIPHHRLLRNWYCFFLETLGISHASQMNLFESYQNHSQVRNKLTILTFTELLQPKINPN